MFLLEPIIQMVLTWLANFVGGLLSSWIKDMANKKEDEKKAQAVIDPIKNATTPEERDNATRNAADNSF